MKLRPHHIYCFYFLSFSHPDRGKEYEEAIRKIERAFKAEKESIEVKEGPDFLCEACPHFNGQMCTHPKGDEREVRKWDKRILEELGLKFGEFVEVGRIRTLVKDKTPLNFCLTKCAYYRQSECNPKIPNISHEF